MERPEGMAFLQHQSPKQSSRLLGSLRPPGCGPSCTCTVARAGAEQAGA